uniref:Uncharacterized protein n=1 Tax=Lepeophtheirus salmonis TaxID=72036 RepID=A0A0K2U3S2_LEPSM
MKRKKITFSSDQHALLFILNYIQTLQNKDLSRFMKFAISTQSFSSDEDTTYYTIVE